MLLPSLQLTPLQIPAPAQAGAAFVHQLYKPSLEIPVSKEPTASVKTSQSAR